MIWPMAPATADGFDPVRSEARFESLIEGRELRRFGITLQVRPDGRIEGRALGREVTGAWRWEDGYFCREMAWGSRELAPNCQVVLFDGRSLRFVADRGEGVRRPAAGLGDQKVDREALFLPVAVAHRLGPVAAAQFPGQRRLGAALRRASASARARCAAGGRGFSLSLMAWLPCCVAP